MPNWINRHVGEVVLAGFGVFGAAAIGFAYNLGENATKLENLSKGVATISDQIEEHEDTVNANFDRLQSRLELDQSDLRSILVATGTAVESDTFHAAVIERDIWVFPDGDLRANFLARGMQPESVNKFLRGFRVMPATTVD